MSSCKDAPSWIDCVSKTCSPIFVYPRSDTATESENEAFMREYGQQFVSSKQRGTVSCLSILTS